MTFPAIQRLQDDHAHYEGLLCILDRQFHAAQLGDLPDSALLRDIFYYLTHHAELTHHAFEDRLFTRLKQRDPAITGTLNLLHEEHRRIEGYGNELYAHFARRAATGDTTEWEPATMNLYQAYLELYRGHLRCEETQVIERLVTTLTGSDWLELVSGCDWGCDTSLLPEASAEYHALKARIAADGSGFWMGDDEPRADFCPLCTG